jgi:hypothetical protein
VSARFYLAETLVAQLDGARSLSWRLPASCGPLAVPAAIRTCSGTKTWKQQDGQVNTVKLKNEEGTSSSKTVFQGVV